MSQPQTTRVAIHGFGRVGRQIFKTLWDLAPANLEVAAIGLSRPEDAPAAAHLLKYDSNYGQWKPRVRHAGGALEVDGRSYRLVAADSLAGLPWAGIMTRLTCTVGAATVSSPPAARYRLNPARSCSLPVSQLTVTWGGRPAWANR